MGETYAAATDRGRRRDANEDEAVASEIPGGVLLAVADGAGGMGGGDVASRLAIERLVEVCRESTESDPPDLLRRAYEAANRAVREAAEGSEHPSMATTLVTAIVREGRAWIANMGDSRAYLVRGGEVTQLTEDDSLVAERVRAGLLTPEQAKRSPARNIITRAIGVESEADIEPIELELEPGDVVLLCSDGVHGVLDDTEIADTVHGKDAAGGVGALIEAANEAGGPDNIGVAVYVASPGR